MYFISYQPRWWSERSYRQRTSRVTRAPCLPALLRHVSSQPHGCEVLFPGVTLVWLAPKALAGNRTHTPQTVRTLFAQVQTRCEEATREHAEPWLRRHFQVPAPSSFRTSFYCVIQNKNLGVIKDYPLNINYPHFQSIKYHILLNTHVDCLLFPTVLPHPMWHRGSLLNLKNLSITGCMHRSGRRGIGRDQRDTRSWRIKENFILL